MVRILAQFDHEDVGPTDLVGPGHARDEEGLDEVLGWF
jgi:hypothetical protein